MSESSKIAGKNVMFVVCGKLDLVAMVVLGKTY